MGRRFTVRDKVISTVSNHYQIQEQKKRGEGGWHVIGAKLVVAFNLQYCTCPLLGVKRLNSVEATNINGV